MELTRFRFPSMLNGYIGTAEAAIMLERWDLAVEKWQAVRLNFPDEHTGYVGQADALRRAGRVSRRMRSYNSDCDGFPQMRH